jgi:hypothetical protein
LAFPAIQENLLLQLDVPAKLRQRSDEKRDAATQQMSDRLSGDFLCGWDDQERLGSKELDGSRASFVADLETALTIPAGMK